MQKKVVIVTGGDTNFFGYIASAFASLEACGCSRQADLAVLDQGLSTEDVARLEAAGYRVAASHTTVDVGRGIRDYKSLGQSGLLPRTELREYFPGYEVYVWFDPDAWAQTAEFLDAFVEGARVHGAAVALENGYGYRRPLADVRWWLGNLALAYGPVRAARLAIKPWINNGLVALRSDVEHWASWRSHYLAILSRTGKHLNQHALFGALHLDRLDVEWISPHCNWICILSPPRWDVGRALMCEPGGAERVLSVLHLAGPDKERLYELVTTAGEKLKTRLTYDVVGALGRNEKTGASFDRK
jgi:NAD(P)-dependent dehydrogenase (short-subunit alcohol dehydrogenase family)